MCVNVRVVVLSKGGDFDMERVYFIDELVNNQYTTTET